MLGLCDAYNLIPESLNTRLWTLFQQETMPDKDLTVPNVPVEDESESCKLRSLVTSDQGESAIVKRFHVVDKSNKHVG